MDRLGSCFTVYGVDHLTLHLTYNFLHDFMMHFKRARGSTTHTSPERRLNIIMASNTLLDDLKKGGDAGFGVDAFQIGRRYLTSKGKSSDSLNQSSL